MSDFVIPAAAPGWYSDPQQPGAVRYWDGTSWTQHVAPGPVAAPAQFGAPPYAGPSGLGADPSDPVHWLLPTGRTWQSIAAGYVGLVAMFTIFPGPIALGLGIWALLESHKTGSHGRGRAIFAIVVGVPTTLLAIAITLQAL